MRRSGPPQAWLLRQMMDQRVTLPHPLRLAGLESDPVPEAADVQPAAKPRSLAAGRGRCWCARFACGHGDGDLAAKAEPGFEPEVVTAPETAGVIPVRAV